MSRAETGTVFVIIDSVGGEDVLLMVSGVCLMREVEMYYQQLL